MPVGRAGEDLLRKRQGGDLGRGAVHGEDADRCRHPALVGGVGVVGGADAERALRPRPFGGRGQLEPAQLQLVVQMRATRGGVGLAAAADLDVPASEPGWQQAANDRVEADA